MTFEAKPNRPGAFRIVLEEHSEGVYVFVFETPSSDHPERDYLQDNLDMAMATCAADFGVERSMWRSTPDQGLR